MSYWKVRYYMSLDPYLPLHHQNVYSGSMYETGCSGLVHWDDPEGWYGEGGGRGVVKAGDHIDIKSFKK